MKTKTFLFVQCVLCCITTTLWAQKKIPYDFYHQADSSAESMQMLTEINQPNAKSLRLYFLGTQLGSTSYLVIDAPDGARQQLRNVDLENWSFSSAYFNGNNVKVSLFSARGEVNKVFISAIKIADAKTLVVQRRHDMSTALSTASTTNRTSVIDYEALPHAAAVGRFTDGHSSYGTGWIAPNGAIVTDHHNVQEAADGDMDVIEFNVPPSDSYGNVNHPGPEDQYPLKYRNETQSFFGFDFKRKHNFNMASEEENQWVTSWGILDALPNSTGLRPGERQQQYFRIAPNLGSFTLEVQDVMVDILHYGETEQDLLDGGANFRTLKKHVTKLEPQSEYLTNTDFDLEGYMVYNLDGGNITFTDSDRGAPITYSGYNIAMGVHSDFYNFAPAVGVGFRNSLLLSSLNDYFSPSMVYVDQNSEWDESTGAIDKPYLNIQDGVDNAEVGGVINIVKGSYNEPLYITKRVTLKAPVGHVVLGATGPLSARKSTLPLEVAGVSTNYAADTEEEQNGSNLTSFPNPFNTATSIQYKVPRSTAVNIAVYDKSGNQVRSLVQDIQSSGAHSATWDGNDQSGKQATPGLYVIKFQTPERSTAIKIIKN